MLNVVEILNKTRHLVEGTEDNADALRAIRELQDEVYDEHHEIDYIYGQMSELKALGYTARQLYHEVNGDGVYRIGSWREWHNECLIPFLDTLSLRLPALSDEFYNQIYHWQEYDRYPEELTPEEEAEKEAERQAREEEDHFTVSSLLVDRIAEHYPDLKGDLEALLDKVKPQEPEEPEETLQQKIESLSEADQNLVGQAAKLLYADEKTAQTTRRIIETHWREYRGEITAAELEQEWAKIRQEIDVME